MYRYPITLTLTSGETIACKAIDTEHNDARAECIKVDINGNTKLIELDTIARLEVRIKNPHFNSVSFKHNNNQG